MRYFLMSAIGMIAILVGCLIEDYISILKDRAKKGDKDDG